SHGCTAQLTVPEAGYRVHRSLTLRCTVRSGSAGTAVSAEPDRIHRSSHSTDAARSPMSTVGALVFPLVIRGITAASATLRPATPCTASLGSTTDISSMPILHVPTWWWYVIAVCRAYSRTSLPERTSGPG